MNDRTDESVSTPGDRLLQALGALASGHRLRILAALHAEPAYVSQLARDVGLSRPLVHMHLQRLEQAGLVSSRLELSEEGKAMRFYEVTAFAVEITPESVAAAAETLSDGAERSGR